MNVIVEPQYVDLLAGELVALTLEVEQAKCFVNEAVAAKETGELLKKACCELTAYLAKQELLRARVKEIAARFGVFCKDADCLVLVGSEYVVRSKNGQLTLIVCAQA